MNILLDSNGLQVRAHMNQEAVKGKRITTFLETLESIFDEPKVTFSKGLIHKDALSGYDLLIILTRIETFEPEERDGIYEFVCDGGNLLLMSNHAPYHKNDHGTRQN